jgi:hypothetical protein
MVIIIIIIIIISSSSSSIKFMISDLLNSFCGSLEEQIRSRKYFYKSATLSKGVQLIDDDDDDHYHHHLHLHHHHHHYHHQVHDLGPAQLVLRVARGADPLAQVLLQVRHAHQGGSVDLSNIIIIIIIIIMFVTRHRPRHSGVT